MSEAVHQSDKLVQLLWKDTGDSNLNITIYYFLFKILRSRSREPYEFKLQGAKLSQMLSSGRRSATPDPHAYFSRPGSSLSIYGGRGGQQETDPFKASMGKQQNGGVMELRNHVGEILINGNDEEKKMGDDKVQDIVETFFDRPMSAMSEISIDMGNLSRPESRTADINVEEDIVSNVKDNIFPIKQVENNNEVLSKEIVRRNIVITAKETNPKENKYQVAAPLQKDDESKKTSNILETMSPSQHNLTIQGGSINAQNDKEDQNLLITKQEQKLKEESEISKNEKKPFVQNKKDLKDSINNKSQTKDEIEKKSDSTITKVNQILIESQNKVEILKENDLVNENSLQQQRRMPNKEIKVESSLDVPVENITGRQEMMKDFPAKKDKLPIEKAKEMFALIAEETKRNSRFSNCGEEKMIMMIDDEIAGEENELKSTGYQHLDDFEKRLKIMAKELEFEEVDESKKAELESFDYITDELTGSQIKRYKNFTEVDNKKNTQILKPVPPPRSRRSKSREPTPAGFLSAMTGGLMESGKFGSITQLVRERSLSKSKMLRHSSIERAGVIPDLVSGADHLVNKLLMITEQKKRVAQVDFDELFAKGLALGEKENENKSELEIKELPMITFQEETGIDINVTEHDRGRQREKKKKSQRTSSKDVSRTARPDSKETTLRNRSRDYANPSDIKLSPVTKRDLFTGKLIDSTEEEVFLKKVTNFIERNQQQLEDLKSVNQRNQENVKTICYAYPEIEKKAQGRQFLESKTGQEMFNKSVETDHDEFVSESLGDPADKNIPKILKPDKLLKNEEFYENLRTGLRNLTSDKVEDEKKNYCSSLGRAEYGILHRKVPISRDASKDKIEMR